MELSLTSLFYGWMNEYMSGMSEYYNMPVKGRGGLFIRFTGILYLLC